MSSCGTIRVAEPGEVFIVDGTLRISPGNPRPGELVTVSFEVRNTNIHGVSFDRVALLDGSVQDSEHASFLAGETDMNTSVDFKLPANLSGGDHRICAEVRNVQEATQPDSLV